MGWSMRFFNSDDTPHARPQRSVLRAVVHFLVLVVAAEIAPAAEPRAATDDPLAWPAASQTARPWTRWWWHGSAVDAENLSRLLQTYRAAGIGGVEITCIYGVRGQKDRSLVYLSVPWIVAVRHVIGEARRLEMGVDMSTGRAGGRAGRASTQQMRTPRSC